jgi:hypothetical protein
LSAETTAQWLARLDARVRAQRAAVGWLVALGAERPLRLPARPDFVGPRDWWFLVHRFGARAEVGEPGRWRMTYFDAAGVPLGHTEAATYREAIELAARECWGDLTSAEIVGHDTPITCPVALSADEAVIGGVCGHCGGEIVDLGAHGAGCGHCADDETEAAAA